MNCPICRIELDGDRWVRCPKCRLIWSSKPDWRSGFELAQAPPTSKTQRIRMTYPWKAILVWLMGSPLGIFGLFSAAVTFYDAVLDPRNLTLWFSAAVCLTFGGSLFLFCFLPAVLWSIRLFKREIIETGAEVWRLRIAPDPRFWQVESWKRSDLRLSKSEIRKIRMTPGYGANFWLEHASGAVFLLAMRDLDEAGSMMKRLCDD